MKAKSLIIAFLLLCFQSIFVDNLLSQITGRLTFQNEVDCSEELEKLESGLCVPRLPTPILVEEPLYTKGNSNTIFFSLGPADSTLKPKDFSIIRIFIWQGDSLDCQIRFIDDPYKATINDSVTIGLFKNKPLEDGKEYIYRMAFYLNVKKNGNDTLYCSPLSDLVFSTQDATPPIVQEWYTFNSNSCINSDSFYIPFKTFDTVCGSVDSAKLYYRTEPDKTWITADSLDLPEDSLAISDQIAVVDSFLFVAEQNGYYEFYVGVKDAARSPNAHPDSSLTGQDGNDEDVPNKNTPPLYESIVVDTQPPGSKVVDLKPEQKSLCFNVNFTADDTLKDDYESGLESVILFYSYENLESFIPIDTLTFNCETDEINSSFTFKAESGDGNYYFYTKAIDCCGNQQVVFPDTAVTVVRGIPQIRSFKPKQNSFNLAAHVDTIEIEFDREVIFEDGWPITVINKYAYFDNEYKKLEFENCVTVKAAEDTFKLICYPKQIDSTGFYEIQVDLCQIKNVGAECKSVSCDTVFSTFYTYMEKDKGGTIKTPEVDITVKPDSLTEHVVIKMETKTLDACPFENFYALYDTNYAEAKMISAYYDIDVPAVSRIPATLTLKYRQLFIDGLIEETFRIFEGKESLCLPAGYANSWESFPGSNKIETELADIQGMFFIMGQFNIPPPEPPIVVGNYPNPFELGNDGKTTITFNLTNAGAKNVKLRIFDLFGNLVKNFTVLPTLQKGINEVEWNGKNDLGDEVAIGGYICVLTVAGDTHKRKIAVMK